MCEKYLCSIRNVLRFSGTKEDLILEISRKIISSNEIEISYNEVYSYVRYFIEHLTEIIKIDNFAPKIYDFGIYFDEDETIKVKIINHPTKEERKSDRLYMSWCEYEYYINLKSSTIILLALLLDLNCTNGIASTVLALLGVNSRTIACIPDYNGERCVLIEICRQKNRQGNKEIFDCIMGRDCINSNLCCQYRIENLCTLSDIALDNIFDILVEKNVLAKLRDMYKYNI